MDYTRQTGYSDPRHHRARLAALPDDPAGIATVVRGLVSHYRASGIDFPPHRLAEIDSRWVDRLLDADASRFTAPLDEPRPAEQRIVGCCRDFALLTVSALRAKGVPARSRVGFADYLEPDYHADHVVTEYHDGTRWIALDSQMDPADDHGVDVTDLPLGPGGLRTAAQSWAACRREGDDPETYGVGRGHPFRGLPVVGKYVLTELAHRQGDELLLWDFWGCPAGLAADLAGRTLAEAWSELPPWRPGEIALIDEIADLLLAADSGDRAAESKLAARYAEDPRLRPGATVTCHSPAGRSLEVDLRRRAATTA
ncbi:transglutaminase-like domain-containing protein [Actinoplanes sp. NEAU-A12]|uniref:Transglutaminase-like domain-containing protein n=1 Tax=Actinoplanes sandaracinus TaxID=3045177 RepID=A0ABT6WU25_9ACTN|nr:transglutaminase-like domain-containing protein [Actinoplanes sandaracinus]MDI6103242.1 transglutaminase-like domain-containing protein [Actinoplanes sandaracinus]